MKTRLASFSAFSLIEVTLALGVAGFGLLAIFGLLPVGLNNNQASIQQTAATNIATEIMADLRQVPTAAAIAANSNLKTTSPRLGIDVTKTASTIYLDENGGPFPAPTSATATSRYKVTVTLTQPSATSPKIATYGIITLGWPAPAPTPLGTVTTFVALDRN